MVNIYLIILLGFVITLFGIGTLTNVFEINLQTLGTFDSEVKCTNGTEEPECIVVGNPVEGHLCANGVVCDEIPEGEYFGEGCSVKYWKNYSGYSWYKDSRIFEEKIAKFSEKLDLLQIKYAEDFADRLEKRYDLFEKRYGEDMAEKYMKSYYEGMEKTIAKYDENVELKKTAYAWKQNSLLDLAKKLSMKSFTWPGGYDPNDKFSSPSFFGNIISVSSSDDLTLLEALSAKGGKENDLASQSVAALLNAAHSDVEYRYSVQEVISLTQQSIIDGNYNIADEFEEYNTLGGSSLCK